MQTVNGYTLVPGTNQLIKSYPTQGSALFGQYGYNISNPGYGDYYNGMQVHGMGFFDSLGELLAGLGLGLAKGSAAGGAGLLSGAKAPASAVNTGTGGGWNPFSLAPAAGLSNTNSLLNNGFKTGLTGGSSYTGDGGYGDADDEDDDDYSNWNGPSVGQRFYAYQELLNHLQSQYQREQWLGVRPWATQPLYVGAYSESPNFGFNPQITYENARLPGDQGNNYQQSPALVASDSIFGINKKIAMVAAIIIAVILIYKFK